MNIVVVDDHASQLRGRVAWLSEISGAQVLGMTFEAAAVYGAAWRDIDVAVLDGHDKRSPERRQAQADAAGVPPLPTLDNFVGVRVAEAIRAETPHERTTIILISAHARDSELRARRIAQAGIDYVFEHYEVDQDRETFVRAVLDPASIEVSAVPARWDERGFAGEPDVAGAIAALEASPAAEMLLDDDLGKHNKDLAWSLRRLRERLNGFMRGKVRPGPGIRDPRAPTKAWLSRHLREALGRDLPTDPPTGQR